VVLDLGGGTFDVTVREVLEGVIEIQSSAGDTRLGGEDFLTAIVDHAVERLERERGVRVGNAPLARARLREACEAVKRRLSHETEAKLVLPDFPAASGNVDVELPLVRSDVEQLFSPLLERMATPIRRALRDAEQRPERIDEVLLVGGATRMPCVARLASQIFGRLALRALPPDEAVALGAAVQVAMKAGDAAVADMVVTDIAPFSLGIASGTEIGGALVDGLFSPILERGTVLPASRVKSFSTLSDSQRQLLLEVYQGEHSLCSENQKIGHFLLKGIPPRPRGMESVEVRFSYDMNGVLDIDATIVSTKKTATFTIERTPGRLSKSEIAETRERLLRLKFHPRESLPNVTALARADALYAELLAGDRAVLGRAIAAFRVALEAQDAGVIEESRQSLIQLTLDLGRELNR
jgi:molecular chaperone HscC